MSKNGTKWGKVVLPIRNPILFMPADTNAAPIFSGTYRHALDGKNRITIPSRWRRSDHDEFFLIPNRRNTFLHVMPPERFRGAAEKAKAAEGASAQEIAVFLRHFYSRSQHVEMDKQGRLLVPEEFCQTLSLHGEIVLLGALETFEDVEP